MREREIERERLQKSIKRKIRKAYTAKFLLKLDQTIFENKLKNT